MWFTTVLQIEICNTGCSLPKADRRSLVAYPDCVGRVAGADGAELIGRPRVAYKACLPMRKGRALTGRRPRDSNPYRMVIDALP